MRAKKQSHQNHMHRRCWPLLAMAAALSLCLLLSSCEEPAIQTQAPPATPSTNSAAPTPSAVLPPFGMEDVPSFSGAPYVSVHGGVPFFTPAELTAESFEEYSELDDLGRCGPAVACVGRDLMPTEKRGSIGMIKPSGWHTIRYDDLIPDKYLYNRCHLIGYQLAGENANVKNLITGTRFLNTQGMLPFEEQVASYVEATGNHVLYRVTPIFQGNDLLARGVLMEGLSVEDNGEGICFCVFAYNAQPDIYIDYSNGESRRADRPGDASIPGPELTPEATQEPAPVAADYIGNKNTKKFHYPDCASVQDMKEKNKYYFNGTRDEMIDQGYVPCKRCCP